MPRYKIDLGYHCPPEIIRFIRHNSGKPKFKVNYDPRMSYGEHKTKIKLDNSYMKSYVDEDQYESAYLYTDIEMRKITNSEEIILDSDKYFLISYHQKILPFTIEWIHLEYERTKVYWLEWIQRSKGFTCYSDEIRRSSLVLKLLSYQETGAIIAAVTTSLPETVGEERNWDYRFCWIRDSAMILKVLNQLGHYNIAKNYFKYILNVIPYKKDKMQIMYGIRWQKDLEEKTLDWLAGYKNSKPVRIGNAAASQKQNDTYGVLLDGIYNYIKFFPNDIVTAEKLWTITRSLVRAVCESWAEPDMGIWEFRSAKSHFVFSKVLCWVALDRGYKIALELNFKKRAEEWLNVRDEIKKDINEKGWNKEIGAYTQSYGSTALDSANLLFADYGFIDAHDERFVSTVKKIKKELSKNDLMFRYKNRDDFGVPKSSFTICSFWMVKALWQIGEKKEAKRIFEKLLSYRNPLGLMGEDLDFETKELLGNFPQGYSHLAMIDCAISLCAEDVTKRTEIVDYIKSSDYKKEEFNV